MTSELANRKCGPCEGNAARLEPGSLRQLAAQLGGGWRVLGEHHLEKEYSFEDFRTALRFTNQIGALAEEEGHHPDIYLTWGKVKVQLWTHKVDGLTENDFILAAKIDAIR